MQCDVDGTRHKYFILYSIEKSFKAQPKPKSSHDDIHVICIMQLACDISKFYMTIHDSNFEVRPLL